MIKIIILLTIEISHCLLKILITLVVIFCLLFLGAFIAGMFYGYHAPMKVK